MPRTRRYVIEVRAEVERRAREVTAPWREIQRARIVLPAPTSTRSSPA